MWSSIMAAAKKSKKDVKGSTVSAHRRARYDYEIIAQYDAGLVLLGTEVKSIRAGAATLSEAYAGFRDDELWLYNVHIAPYGPARENHESTRVRKLLLHRRELDRLRRTMKENPRTTVIPLRMYIYRGLIKVELGIGRGRRQYDKRQAIKKRESDRSMQRAVRQNQR